MYGWEGFTVREQIKMVLFSIITTMAICIFFGVILWLWYLNFRYGGL